MGGLCSLAIGIIAEFRRHGLRTKEFSFFDFTPSGFGRTGGMNEAAEIEKKLFERSESFFGR